MHLQVYIMNIGEESILQMKIMHFRIGDLFNPFMSKLYWTSVP